MFESSLDKLLSCILQLNHILLKKAHGHVGQIEINKSFVAMGLQP